MWDSVSIPWHGIYPVTRHLSNELRPRLNADDIVAPTREIREIDRCATEGEEYAAAERVESGLGGVGEGSLCVCRGVDWVVEWLSGYVVGWCIG